MTVLKKRGLNRGLSSLLSSASLDTSSIIATEGQLSLLAITKIQPGKYQPRQEFDQETLQELAESIRAQGVIQPIVVRSIGPQRYEIIAGERRWRAAQLANLPEVPVLIREVADNAAIAMSLIENIQRENLNVIEEANALKRLLEEFQMTQQQVAEAIGKSRVTVTNLLRLLDLHPQVINFLQTGALDQGHAKVLLALPSTEQLRAATIVVNKSLSVRETERLVHQWQSPGKDKLLKKSSPDIHRLEQTLSDQLGTTVTIQHSNHGRGKMIIHYPNLDILDGILSRLTPKKRLINAVD